MSIEVCSSQYGETKTRLNLAGSREDKILHERIEIAANWKELLKFIPLQWDDPFANYNNDFVDGSPINSNRELSVSICDMNQGKLQGGNRIVDHNDPSQNAQLVTPVQDEDPSLRGSDRQS